MHTFIYHIVTLNELRAQTHNGYYQPGNFEDFGFIHCTGDVSSSMLVLEDYFKEISKSSMILVLEIDVAWVESEVKFEPPAPIQGAGTSHLADGVLFPHIYGRLNIDAVAGVGKVDTVEGKFLWPQRFERLESYLAEDPPAPDSANRDS